MTALALEPIARTHVGRRANNEDAVLATPRLAAVADGVGGAAAGEVASRTVINALAHLDKCRLRDPLPDAVAGAVARGNDTIGFVASCRPQYAGMSTTLTAVALSNEGEYVVANVGDSRTYLLRDGELRRLTRDDSLVQALVDAGRLGAHEVRDHPQRSVVMEALDGRPRGRTDVLVLEARASDRLLLCSDGLTDVVDDDAVAAALAEHDRRAAAQRLLELALAGGGRDNVSVVVADVRAGARVPWAT